MSEKSGRSEEKTDIFGNKYTEHYDADGKSVGRSEERSGIFGTYTQHYDRDGKKAGTSEERTSVFGDYTQHYDADGKRGGTSRYTSDIFGQRYTQHYDQADSKSGTSERRSSLAGSYTQHYGRGGLPKDHREATAWDDLSSSDSGGSPNTSSGGSGILWLLGLALVAGVIWLVGSSPQRRPTTDQASPSSIWPSVSTERSGFDPKRHTVIAAFQSPDGHEFVLVPIAIASSADYVPLAQEVENRIGERLKPEDFVPGISADRFNRQSHRIVGAIATSIMNRTKNFEAYRQGKHVGRFTIRKLSVMFIGACIKVVGSGVASGFTPTHDTIAISGNRSRQALTAGAREFTPAELKELRSQYGTAHDPESFSYWVLGSLDINGNGRPDILAVRTIGEVADLYVLRQRGAEFLQICLIPGWAGS